LHSFSECYGGKKGNKINKKFTCCRRKQFSHTANTIFKTKLYGKKFWTEGHFYRSVGAVNSETMKHYVEESQEKHWKKTSFKDKEVMVLQRRINEF